MQVMPFHANAGENLRDPDTCISKGVSILKYYIDYMGNVRSGVGAYNCGAAGLTRGSCGSTGGYVYADHVLDIYSQLRRK